MDAHAAVEVEEWEPVSFSGGYEGLHELAGSEFSGAVESDGATLYMVNGRVVAVDGGSIEAFETGGTARGAPHYSLPLLYAMQSLGGRTRASYYTEDTPIPNVDETLKDGGFTGYVELAENVLSGDYYVVYQGGRSTGVAFVGQSRRLVTGQEAYERASDEVGIYDVVSVDLDVIEIPGEPPEDDATAGGVAAGDDATAGEEPTADEHEDATGGPAASDEPADEATGATTDEAEDVTDPDDTDSPGEVGPEPEEEPADAADADTAESPDTEEPTAGADEDDLDDRPVPSLDVEPSGGAAGSAGAAGIPGEDETRDAEVDDSPVEEATEEAASGEPDTGEEAAGEPEAGTGAGHAASGTASGEAGAERPPAEPAIPRGEWDDLVARVERLEARIEELTAGAASAGAGAGSGESAGPALSADEALSGTNLFVRYRSKADPTLEDARAGGATASDVRENVRIEYHTEFENEGATVDGRPFVAWLTDRPEHAFLEWLVEELLFEIRATGSVEAMRKLYGAIPEIDRVELDADIHVEDVVGEGSRDVRFDLVARGPKGNPLVVADIESSREPTTGDALASLVTDATDLVAVDEALAGTFFVTSSYFEPDALATAEEATGGSLLSRDKRVSFVRHSRKRGYHLCLVERREGSFHLKQPDL